MTYAPASGLIREHLRCDRDVPADSNAIDTERAQLQVPQPIRLQLHDMRREGRAKHDGASPVALERVLAGWATPEVALAS